MASSPAKPSPRKIFPADSAPSMKSSKPSKPRAASAAAISSPDWAARSSPSPPRSSFFARWRHNARKTRDACLLAATDPANPWGSILHWPRPTPPPSDNTTSLTRSVGRQRHPAQRRHWSPISGAAIRPFRSFCRADEPDRSEVARDLAHFLADYAQELLQNPRNTSQWRYLNRRYREASPPTSTSSPDFFAKPASIPRPAASTSVTCTSTSGPRTGFSANSS